MNRSRALNNQLFDMNSDSGDFSLQNLLLKREDTLQRRNALECKLFSDIRENLNKAIIDAEKKREDYLETKNLRLKYCN